MSEQDVGVPGPRPTTGVALDGALTTLRRAVKDRQEVMALSSPPCTAEMIRAAHKRVDDAVDALLAEAGQ